VVICICLKLFVRTDYIHGLKELEILITPRVF